MLIIQNMNCSEKKRNQNHQIIYILSDFLRCWKITEAWILFVNVVIFICYAIPILHAVHQVANINSTMASILSFLTTKIKQAESDPLTSSLITGTSTFALGILAYIGAQNYRGRKMKKRITNEVVFRTLVLTLYLFLFPLSMFLTGFLVKRLVEQPLISVFCGVNLLGLSILGFFLQGIKTIQNNSCLLFGKLQLRGDRKILVIKMLLVSLFYLNSDGSDKLCISILLVLGLLISLNELYEILFIAKYHSETYQRSVTFFKLFEFVIVAESILAIFLEDPILRSNLDLLTISLIIFPFLAARTFFNDRSSTLVLNDPGKLTNEKTAILFARELISLCAEKSQEDMIRPFLLYQHKKDCFNVECFCHRTYKQGFQTYESKQHFINGYLVDVMRKMKELFPRSLTILSFYITAKMRNQTKFIGFSQLLSSFKEQDTENGYIFYQYEQILKNQLEELNQSREIIPIEQVIQENQVQDILKEQLNMLSCTFQAKYKLLSQQIVLISEVMELNNKINMNIRVIERLWRERIQSGTLSINLEPMFLIYFHNLISSPRQAKNLKSALLQKIQQFNHFDSSKQNSLTMMYSPQACVFESILNQNLGIVSNVSKSVSSVLNIQRNQILGENIHSLMPQFLSQGHRTALKRWFEGESFLNEKGIQPEFFADSCLNAFHCFTFNKLHCSGSELRFYKMIIRKDNYNVLLISKEGSIEGIGPQLLQSGLFQKDHLHKNISLFIDPKIILQTCGNRKEDQQLNLCFISQIIKEKGGNEPIQMFKCTLTRHEQQLGNLSYFALVFSSILKVDYTSQALCSLLNCQDCSNLSNPKYIQYEPSSNSGSQIRADIIRTESSIQDTIKLTEYDKLIMKLKRLTCFPQSNTLQWRAFVSATLLLIVILGFCLFIYQEQIFGQSFNSFDSMLQAANKASSSNLMLQVLHNNALRINTFCYKLNMSMMCNHLRRCNQDYLSEFYINFVKESASYFSGESYLTGEQFSQLKIMTTLTFDNHSTELTYLQFVENYYQQAKAIQDLTSDQASITDSLNFLLVNFESLKNLNHKVIAFFKENGKQELHLLLKYYLALMISIISLMAAFMIIIKVYLNERWKKNNALLNLYRLISRRIASSLVNHFKTKKHITTPLPLIQDETFHEGLSNYHVSDKEHNYLIALLVVIAIPLAFYMIYPVATIFSPASSVLTVTTALYSSQSQILQKYFDLKSDYEGFNLISPGKTSQQLLFQVNQTEFEFMQIIQSNLGVFSSLDSAFGEEFNLLLTQNLCILNKEVLNVHDVVLCEEGEQDHTLNKGIISVFYLLQRATLGGMRSIISNEGDDSWIFTEQLYQRLDDYMIFYLKTFAMMQDRMREALMKEIPVRSHILLVTHVVSIVIVLIIWFIWLLLAAVEKEKISDICGDVLQLPSTVLTKKHVVRKIQDLLNDV